MLSHNAFHKSIISANVVATQHNSVQVFNHVGAQYISKNKVYESC